MIVALGDDESDIVGTSGVGGSEELPKTFRAFDAVLVESVFGLSAFLFAVPHEDDLVAVRRAERREEQQGEHQHRKSSE